MRGMAATPSALGPILGLNSTSHDKQDIQGVSPTTAIPNPPHGKMRVL